jgi:tetratricopeptide (TPR) repeat protein
MQAVAQQAQAISDRGPAMAQRGMLFAGREELIKALQLIAQALDVQQGNSTHAAALASGLTALEEARDFAASSQRPGSVVDVAAVAKAHRTPVLKGDAAAGRSPVVAQQQYFGYAQLQLALAAGTEPVASLALYRLGRLQTALAAHDAAPTALHGPQAMVFHQAALAIDNRNYLAANELGVLLARYGQLDGARELLTRSISIRPQVESWHNLAVVHRRLGEGELARRAEGERDQLAHKSGGRASGAEGRVQWVDTKAFVSAGGGDVAWPENPATKSTAAATTGQRR